VQLNEYPVVGLGSVAARQLSNAAWTMLMLMSQTYRVHGFGLSITGVGAFRQYLESADSSAWSFAASKQERLRGCTHPGKCNNCLRFALRWRKKVVNAERTRHPETHHCTCDTCQDDGRRSIVAIEALDNSATAALLKSSA
jgi:hypothetical protein